MLDISYIKKQYESGELSPVDLIKELTDKIKQEDRQTQAVLEIFDDALSQAQKAEQMIQEGKSLPLLGIPFILKDNILIKGKTASAASKMLENYTATYDSTVAKRLKDAGAIILGRANMDEFAMGSSTENSAFQITKNPHDTSRVPGGSSGGSAASVAKGFCPVALGTDTGGSVRQPAAFCGVVGFKPSYGAISRFGLIAMGSSLDQAGILANKVEDVKLVFEVLYGKDKYDATSLPKDMLNKNIKSNGKKIGVPRDFLKEGVSKEVLDAFENSLQILKKEGYEIIDINLPSFKYALSAYYIIMPAEVSTNLARFDGLRYGLHIDGKDYADSFAKSRSAGFGDEVKRRILLGTFVLSSGYMDAYYYKAVATRELIRKELASVMEQVDLIATPTTPTYAFKLGEKTDPVSMYAADIFTVPVNITKTPAISMPMGHVEVNGKKLPLGIQFITKEMHDFALLDFAKDFENVYAKHS